MEESADFVIHSLIQEIINSGDGSYFRNVFKDLKHDTRNSFEEIILENKLSSIFLTFIYKNKLSDFIDNGDFFKNCSFQKKRFQLHSLEIIKEVHLINSLFKREGLTPIYLKGIAMQNEYEDIALRPLSDVDILFKKSELLRAYQILHENNLLSSKENQYIDENNIAHYCQSFHHIEVKTKNNISLELHHRVTKANDVDFLNCPLSSHFFNDFRTINYYGAKINIPSIENTIIHQLCHLCINTDFCRLLLTLTDINKLIGNYEIDWKKVISKYENKKIRKSLCLSLDLFYLNKVLDDGFHIIKKEFSEYFPEKKVLEEAQRKLFFGSREKIDGQSLYTAILGHSHVSLKRTLRRIFLPQKEMLIYRFKISKPSKYLLIKIYIRYFYEELYKILSLPYFIISSIKGSYVKDTRSIKIWLGKD